MSEFVNGDYHGTYRQKINRAFRKTCSLSYCKERNSNFNVSFHRIPKSEKMRKLWIAACKIDENVSDNFAICSKHFDKDDFIRGKHPKWY